MQPMLVGNRAFRRALLGEEAILLDRFLAALRIDDPTEIEAAHRTRAMTSLGFRFRGHYASLPRQRLQSWLPLSDEVEPALRSGGVLLVATHFGGGLLTPLALSRLGVPIYVVASLPKNARLRTSFEHPCLEVCDLKNVPGHVAAAMALSNLRRGGVVFVAGDLAAPREADNIEVNVLGFPWRLSRGFAEIALSARLAPTPIFSRVEADGRFLTWVEAPLEARGTTRRARAESLVHAYAERLSRTFRRYPGNIGMQAIRRFLADQATPGR